MIIVKRNILSQDLKEVVLNFLANKGYKDGVQCFDKGDFTFFSFAGDVPPQAVLTQLQNATDAQIESYSEYGSHDNKKKLDAFIAKHTKKLALESILANENLTTAQENYITDILNNL